MLGVFTSMLFLFSFFTSVFFIVVLLSVRESLVAVVGVTRIIGILEAYPRLLLVLACENVPGNATNDSSFRFSCPHPNAAAPTRAPASR